MKFAPLTDKVCGGRFEMRTVRPTKTPGFQVFNNSASSALVDFRRAHPRPASIILWFVVPVAIVFLSVTGFLFGILP